MKIIILHGEQGTGKTTLLNSAALYVEPVNPIFGDIIKKDGERHLFIDEFDFETESVRSLGSNNLNYAWITSSQLPSDYKDMFDLFINVEYSLIVRETMFPFCNYIEQVTNSENELVYSADFGGYSQQDKDYGRLLKQIIPTSYEAKFKGRVYKEYCALIKDLEPPLNFREWGLDYGYIKQMQNIQDGVSFTTDGNQLSALVNYSGGHYPFLEKAIEIIFE